jgi:TatD DNase family protein
MCKPSSRISKVSQRIFYDTHAHLDFPDFEKDLEALISRAEAAGISRIISIGTTLDASRKAVELSNRFPQVYAAVGWHPSYVTSAPAQIPAELHDLAAHPKVVAIGEIGLDYSRLPSTSGGTTEDDARYKERQAVLFQQQLDLAAKLNLNVIVHQRDSFADTAKMLQPYTPKLRAVFHCFVGTPAEAQQVAALGSLVSFTGIVTFKNASVVRETVRSLPLTGFMLETDCPFLAPVPYRGKRCEPAYVAEIAKSIAHEKECTLEELSTATCETARSFFRQLG